MCMEDVRLGRKTGPAATFFDVPDAGNTKIADQNPLRVSLIISCPNAAGVFVAPIPLDPSNAQGHRMIQGNEPLMLDIQHYGALVTQEWRASGDAAASSVIVLEAILNDQ